MGYTIVLLELLTFLGLGNGASADARNPTIVTGDSARDRSSVQPSLPMLIEHGAEMLGERVPHH